MQIEPPTYWLEVHLSTPCSHSRKSHIKYVYNKMYIICVFVKRETYSCDLNVIICTQVLCFCWQHATGLMTTNHAYRFSLIGNCPYKVIYFLSLSLQLWIPRSWLPQPSWRRTETQGNWLSFCRVCYLSHEWTSSCNLLSYTIISANLCTNISHLKTHI